MPRATVSSVESYRVVDNEVHLSCEVDFDHSATKQKYELPTTDIPVSITFYSPRVFRFELRADDTVPPRKDTEVELFPHALEEEVSIEVSEHDEGLHIDSGALNIEIGLNEWRFAVATADGDILLEEERSDVSAKGEKRTEPLGYTLKRINRWPYRIEHAGSSFALYPDEHIYGLGEKFTDLDKRGQRIEAWVTQANSAETELAYKNVPFYLSTKGYGLLVDTMQRTVFDMGATSAVSKEITVDDDRFAYVFFYGPSFADIITEYTAVTGRPGAVPKWSLGIWMSRMAYQTREEVEAVASGIRDRSFPCDVLNLDPPWLREDHLCDFVWDREAFPEPEEMISGLHDRGFKLCLWEYPYLLSKTDVFDEAVKNGYVIGNPRGRPYMLTRLSWAADNGSIVDFTNPAAREWWKSHHTDLIEMGVDAFKTDFGEYLPRDAIMADGRSGKCARNHQPLLYTQTVYEAMEEAGVEPLLWARPSWTGGQRYPVHWGGDPNSTFGALAASLRGGLSLGLCGFAFWSCDIGGYSGQPSPELYVRWAQVGLLGMSHSRFHGTTPREPWAFGPEIEGIVTRYANERYRLLPYLHRLAIAATETGLPVMRPLILEFQHDLSVRDIQTQHMLGEALLIAPVLSETRSRAVYLPPGDWVDYWTGERVRGGKTIEVDTPLETMPVYQRGGTIIPSQEPTRYVDESPPEWIDLRVVLADNIDCTTTVYAFDDAGEHVSVHRTEEDEIHVEIDGNSANYRVNIRGESSEPNGVIVNGISANRDASLGEAKSWNYNEKAGQIDIRC